MFAVFASAIWLLAHAAVPAEPAPPEPPSACRPPEGAAVVFWLNPVDKAPGSTLKVEAFFTRGPWEMEPVPSQCLSQVSVNDASVAELAPDGRSVRIRDNAPDGAIIEISGRVDTATVKGGVRVVDPSRNPLVGNWHEVSATCPSGGSGRPLQELSFDGGRNFSVTWTPFETYRDYWGPYTYDAAGGALAMKAEGGNHVPGDLDLDGEARIGADGRLTVTGMSFGQPTGPGPGPGCTFVFAR